MKQSQAVDPLWCNQKTLAAIFKMSPTTLDKLADLPSEKRGRERLYHIPTCVQWLLAKERTKLSSLSEEQAHYTRVRRERQELLLKKEEGELFPMSEGIRLVTAWALELKGNLESMDERLPKRLAAETDWRQIKALLKKEHAEVLAAFGKMKFE